MDKKGSVVLDEEEILDQAESPVRTAVIGFDRQGLVLLPLAR